MEFSGFDERDGLNSADWRFLPLVAGVSCAWLFAATLLSPVIGLVDDLRALGARSLPRHPARP